MFINFYLFIYLFILVSSDEMFCVFTPNLHVSTHTRKPTVFNECPRVNLHVSTHTRKSTIFHELFLCKSTRIYTCPKIHHFPRIVHVLIYTYTHKPENPPFSTNCSRVNRHVYTHTRKSTIFHELFTCKSTRIYTYPKIHHFPRVLHV